MIRRPYLARRRRGIPSRIASLSPARQHPEKALSFQAVTEHALRSAFPRQARLCPGERVLSWFRLFTDIEPSRLEIRNRPGTTCGRIGGLYVVGEIREAVSRRKIAGGVIRSASACYEIEVLWAA